MIEDSPTHEAESFGVFFPLISAPLNSKRNASFTFHCLFLLRFCSKCRKMHLTKLLHTSIYWLYPITPIIYGFGDLILPKIRFGLNQ